MRDPQVHSTGPNRGAPGATRAGDISNATYGLAAHLDGVAGWIYNRGER